MAKKYPAVFSLFAIVAGIVFADNTTVPSWIFLVLIIIIFPLSIIAYFKEKSATIGILILLGLASLSAFGYSFRYRTFPPRNIIHFVDNDEKYRVFGTVDDWPIVREHRTSVYLEVDSLTNEEQTIRSSGRLLLNIGAETTRFQYGDRLQFETGLYSIKGGRNPSGLDYRRYLNLKNIFAVAYLPNQFSILVDPTGPGYYMRLVDRLRKAIINVFKATLDPHSAALASGFLIGETRDIPIEIYNLFRDSGTLHLLAVSGSNVALVVMFFIFILRASPLSVAKRTLFLLGVIVVFTLLSYNQPSVVRAAVMASLILIGRSFQRKIDANNIIASTAMIILLVRPAELYDIGFQLSFITAWGLIFFTPFVTQFFKSLQSRLYYQVLILTFIISIIAQLVALPLSAYYFRQLPLISFVSNIVIVPLVSIIVVGEVTLLSGSLILPILGSFIGSLLNPFLELTRYLLNLFGSGTMVMPVTFQPTMLLLFLYYVLLIMVALSIKSKASRRWVVLLALIVVNVFLFSDLTADREDGRITIFSSPGGIVAFGELGNNQLLLSDLPLKDYYITEKTVLPYLLNNDIEKYDIIALSNDYQTIKETAVLTSYNSHTRGLIPKSAVNIYRDIVLQSDLEYDSTRVVLYEKMNDIKNVNDGDAFLTDQMMIYNFDTTRIIYTNNIDILNEFKSELEADKNLSILIMTTLDRARLNALTAGEEIFPSYIVCHHLTKSARRLLASDKPHAFSGLKVIETSQVGAVEIVTKDNRIMSMKCGNYSVF